MNYGSNKMKLLLPNAHKGLLLLLVNMNVSSNLNVELFNKRLTGGFLITDEIVSLSEIGGETRLLQNNNNTNKKGDIMSWLVYKAKVVGTYTFIYAQKVWGLLPF